MTHAFEKSLKLTSFNKKNVRRAKGSKAVRPENGRGKAEEFWPRTHGLLPMGACTGGQSYPVFTVLPHPRALYIEAGLWKGSGGTLQATDGCRPVFLKFGSSSLGGDHAHSDALERHICVHPKVSTLTWAPHLLQVQEATNRQVRTRWQGE